MDPPRVRHISPVAEQIRYWQSLANLKELGVSLTLRDVSPRDIEGMMMLRLAQDKARESRRKTEAKPNGGTVRH